MGRPIRLVCLALALWSTTARSAAQTQKLNGPLPCALRSGNVTHFAVSPDGARIVYRADKRLAGTLELYSVPLDASAPSVCLSGRMRPGGNVELGFGGRAFAIASDGRVFYLADHRTESLYELYVVPIDGSASPVCITPGSAVAGFWLTPTDDLLFRGNGLDLYRLPAGGGAPHGIAFNLFVDDVFVSPDGATTVFSAQAFAQNQWLYRVPTDGSAAPFLIDTSEPQTVEEHRSYFDEVRFAPDGVHLLYRERMVIADGEEGEDRYDLFSATLDDSQPPVVLNQTDPWFRGGYAFDPSPGTTRLAFVEAGIVLSVAFDGSGLASLFSAGAQDDEIPFVVRGPDVFIRKESGADQHLWRAPIDASTAAAPLFPAMPAFIRAFAPAGARVVFSTNVDLYSVPAAGGTPLALNPPSNQMRQFLVEPSGQSILFRSRLVAQGADELFRVPADGSAPPLRLSVPPQVVSDFVLAPGERVLYRANEWTTNSDSDLLGTTLDGAGPLVHYNELTLSDVLTGDVTGFRTTADGGTVVYRADQEANEVFDLYSAHPSGLGAPLRLTGGLAGAPLVLAEFELTPDGARVLFQTSAGGTFVLWSTLTTVAVAPVELDSSAYGLDALVRASPDGGRVVYKRSDAAGRRELRSAPSDGSAAAVTLNAPLPAGYSVQEFEIAPDGARVVYRVGSSSLGLFELFSVPIDGSAPPQRLHAPLSTTHAVAEFRIAPGGRRVVFRGDLAVNNLDELYSVRLGGGAAPRKLNGPLPANGDVTAFVLSPDGRTAVYRADQIADQRFDLFRVPVEGGKVRRRGAPPGGDAILLTALTGTSRVEPPFAFTPDGAQVVYRANDVGGGETELFRVPADGSGAPVKLSAPLVSGGDVRSFALAPDGSRVVYRADQRILDVLELSSVSLSGGPAVLLDPLPSFADAGEYRIDPESLRVVYLADRLVNNRDELFAVPLDASAPPERLSRAFDVNGAVQDDFQLAPGGRTFYRADHDQVNAFELYVDLDLADAILPPGRTRER